MSSYQIIDEPHPGAYENLIVNPVTILFLSIFIPFFMDLPFYGKFWMPLVWLTANGHFLGSPTRWKETFIAIGGLAIILVLSGIILTLFDSDETLASFILPYYRIVTQAVLFFTLYIIVLYQSAPFSLREYLKQHRT